MVRRRVSLAKWPDMWLNEGFATFSEWIYAEMHGGPPAQDRFDELYAIPEDDPAFEDLCVPRSGSAPGSEPALHHAGLRPGAMTLQALRTELATFIVEKGKPLITLAE